MIDKRNAPEVRFDGFTDDWVVDTLGELTDVYDGTHQTPTYTESGIMFLSVENIKTMTSNKFISAEAFNNDFKVYPQKGDVLMTRIGDIGTANIVESDDPIAYYVSLALLKKKTLNPYFLKSVIQTEAVWRELWHRTLHIAFPKKINMGEIKKVLVNYPASEIEQTAIGNFFRDLDDTISLKKQQHEKTLNIKKAMLEKMFPKKGADVPEIRFDGFSENWSIKRLDEVFVPSVPNNTLSRSELNYESGDIKNIHYGDVLMKFGAYLDSSDKIIPFIINARVQEYRSYLLKDGDIVFADTAEDEMVGKAVEVTNTESSNIVSGLHTYVYRPQIRTSSYFFGYYLNSQSYRGQLLSLMQGVKVLSINRSNLSKTLICYPDSLDEQSAIGNYFRSLDILIEAERQEIDKLQNIKNACLSKMFV